MAGSFEVTFRRLNHAGPRNHILDGGPDPPPEGATFE